MFYNYMQLLYGEDWPFSPDNRTAVPYAFCFSVEDKVSWFIWSRSEDGMLQALKPPAPLLS